MFDAKTTYMGGNEAASSRAVELDLLIRPGSVRISWLGMPSSVTPALSECSQFLW